MTAESREMGKTEREDKFRKKRSCWKASYVTTAPNNEVLSFLVDSEALKTPRNKSKPKVEGQTDILQRTKGGRRTLLTYMAS
jgi:hypothetical protein